MKRMAILTYDVVGLLLVSAALSFAFVKPAYAYVDPSVMTYAIQAFAGVAVAQGQIVAGAWKKHGGRCNNRYYCSGRNYVFPQMRIHVNTR